MLKFTPWSHPWPPTAPPLCSWPSGWSEADESGPKWFPIPKNIGIDTKNKSPAWVTISLLEVVFGSYSPSTLFLTFRWVWGFWKWSQMISHGPKHGVRHQNQVSSMFRSKVIISLLEVVLGLLQPLHPVLVLQGSLKMVPNDSPWPKTWGLTPK